MAIATMKLIVQIVFMMEVTVVEGVPTLTNAQIVFVTMEKQLELMNHVSDFILIAILFIYPPNFNNYIKIGNLVE